MTEVNKYLNNLELRLIFDDGETGRIYILNPDKTSIYFIIDVEDNCLYINQSILNIYTEKEIKAFLDDIGVGMDIFPYFDDFSDIQGLKPSTQKYFKIIMDNTTSIKIDFKKYSNYIFLFYMNINMLHCDLKNYHFYNNYNSIWSKIQPEDEYKYDDTQRIIKESVEGHFKNRVTTPYLYYLENLPYVEGHFKNRVTTPLFSPVLKSPNVEGHFKKK